MNHARLMIVVAVAVGIGVGMVALRARSDDGDVVGSVADLPDPTSAEAESQRRALAIRAGIRVEDLLVKPSHPEGATPEEFEASRRARADSAGRDTAIDADVALRQRLAWAAEYAEGQRRERARKAVFGEAPAATVPTATDAGTCRSFCELLLRCNGSSASGDWDGCVAACGRGEFGSQVHLESVLALRNCEHL